MRHVSVHALLSLSVWLLVKAGPHQGEEVLCIGPRPHRVEYNLKGDSVETLEDAFISVAPALDMNSNTCVPSSSGDKALCIGANQDATCAHAKSDFPLAHGFDCVNCFAGATTDLFYKLSVSGFTLYGVEVGLQNTHLRGAVEVHGAASGASEPVKGQITLLDGDKTAKISFKIAKIVPVDITVGLPTILDYSVGVSGSFEATAGADLDIQLGDHFVKWTRAGGFAVMNGSPSVTVTPKLAVNVKAQADMSVKLQSSAQIDIDKVMWYHLNMASALPVNVALNDQDTEVCAVGGVDFQAGHEADVHFSLFGKETDIKHFGPKELYHYHKDDVARKCVDIPKPPILV
eukprot:TRINITY_DN4068_c0_g1_i6.p1 TRINITY_DN4068_c0_g1~~TRINITY_DN4068_c0_g1_i6.p1  ORF type:complete len:346 (-),score=53.93 TRINITY_DN4068_c0_g1_i6:214-1251(-)